VWVPHPLAYGSTKDASLLLTPQCSDGFDASREVFEQGAPLNLVLKAQFQ
jgi:hypothetical protein